MKKYAVMALVVLVLLSGAGFLVGAMVSPPSKIPGGQFQDVWNAIIDLQNQITHIQLLPGPQGPQGIQGETGPQGPVGPMSLGALSVTPDYDSGWVKTSEIPQGLLVHQLMTTNCFVYAVGTGELVNGQPRDFIYSGLPGTYLGWYLTPYVISVETSYTYVRFMVWKLG